MEPNQIIANLSYMAKRTVMPETLPGALALAGKMIGEAQPAGASLFSGSAGTLYYYFHGYRLTGRASYLEKIIRLAPELMPEAFNDEAADISLATGIAGMCSVLHLLHEQKLIKTLPPEALRTDEYLFTSCMESVNGNGFSFTSGTAGIASYFSKRGESALMRKYLAEMVQKLLDTELAEDTTTEIDFTLWQGLCGKLSLLFRLLQHFPAKVNVRMRLLHYLHILRNHILQIDAGLGRFSFFPVTADEKTGLVHAPNYLFWEAGDLPVVQLLYKAYDVFGDDDYKKLAGLAGSYTLTRRSAEETLVETPCFSSGACGTAMMYRLLEKVSGVSNYNKGYTYWMNRSVALFGEQAIQNGFAHREHSLANGLTGLALGWMDHLYSDKQDWTYILMP